MGLGPPVIEFYRQLKLRGALEGITEVMGLGSQEHTIYYHENDLPSGLAQRVAPFDAFVDAILARMSPPVSHVAHFHWVPAVRAYRENMIRGGSDARVELLDDPRNLSAAR